MKANENMRRLPSSSNCKCFYHSISWRWFQTARDQSFRISPLHRPSLNSPERTFGRFRNRNHKVFKRNLSLGFIRTGSEIMAKRRLWNLNGSFNDETEVPRLMEEWGRLKMSEKSSEGSVLEMRKVETNGIYTLKIKSQPHGTLFSESSVLQQRGGNRGDGAASGSSSGLRYDWEQQQLRTVQTERLVLVNHFVFQHFINFLSCFLFKIWNLCCSMNFLCCPLFLCLFAQLESNPFFNRLAQIELGENSKKIRRTKFWSTLQEGFCDFSVFTRRHWNYLLISKFFGLLS